MTWLTRASYYCLPKPGVAIYSIVARVGSNRFDERTVYDSVDIERVGCRYATGGDLEQLVNISFTQGRKKLTVEVVLLRECCPAEVATKGRLCCAALLARGLDLGGANFALHYCSRRGHKCKIVLIRAHWSKRDGRVRVGEGILIMAGAAVKGLSVIGRKILPRS